MWLLPRLLRFNKSVCKSSMLPRLLRFNKSVCKSWRATTSFFVDHQTTTTTTSSSSSSSSRFGSFILETYGRKDEDDDDDDDLDDSGDIKMFMLSFGSGDGGGTGEEEEEDDDQIQIQKKKKKKMVFKLDEDLGFSAFYKDFRLHDTSCIVGSCNGIICLHDPRVMEASRGCTGQHYLNLRDVCLWNPATRQFRILPKSIPNQENEDRGLYEWCDFIMFGFDVKTKDYKVVRITPLFNDDGLEEEGGGGGCMFQVQLYCLSTDSWRLLEDIYIPNKPRRLYLNGSYNNCSFLGYTDRRRLHDSVLLSFDFTKEIFTTIQLPDNCSSSSSSIYNKLVLSYLGKKWAAFTTPRIHNNSTSVLSYLDDKMAVFTTPQPIDSDGNYWYFDIWVLNEQHGSSGSSVAVYKESWTKLHSFRIKTELPYFKSKCISINGEFALISTRENKLQLFNLVTKEAIKDFTIGTRECTSAYVYEESRVSIMGGNVLLRWQLPTHGTTYKLNLDAPFIPSNFAFGIGLCLTSDTGGCIGVRSLNRDVSDAAEGEALAMLEAIKWAIKLELSPIIIESDSKNVVSFFMDDDDNNSAYWSSEALSLLREAKLLLNSSDIGIISLKYCSRSCNYVADIAAKLGRERFGYKTCKDWSSANFPGEIVMSLSGIETWSK